MTVEEYAAACEEIGSNFDSVADTDFTSGFEAMEDALAEVRRWDPPGELQEFHDVTVRAAETLIRALKETGAFDLMREFEKAAEEEDEAKVLELMGRMAELEEAMDQIDDQISELDEEVERAEEKLSPATREILADADCL